MAILKINKKTITFEHHSYKTLAELLLLVFENLDIQNYAVNDLFIDNESIIADAENQLFHQNIQEESIVEIILTKRHDITDADLYFMQLLLENAVNEPLGNGLQLFMRLTAILSKSFPEETHIQQITMLSIIKGIKIALEKNDHFMLQDLIDFELKDSLKQWKILVTKAKHIHQVKIDTPINLST